ncbi:O-antigen ligase family protein [Levilinea saccharolytica]|nr:O-antigen ligase family protein [Levilinea saccharolytica]GAP18818.1 lipid A core - O-antigen ligase [Levilinea saccharolytica]
MSRDSSTSYIKSRSTPRDAGKTMRVLFALFSIYLVLPLVDVPVFGFSLSAVLFALIFLLSIRSKRYSFSKYQGWLLLAVWIAFGVLLSFFLNGFLSGGTDIEGASIAVHYLYWLFLFVVVLYLLSEGVVSIQKVVEILGMSVFILALLRVFELAFLGKIGAWTGTRFFPQNTYGFLFSMFVPTNYYLILEKRGREKWFAVIRLLVILLAVLVNGSRGSWIALGISLAAFLILAVISMRSVKPLGTFLLVLLVISVGYLSFRNLMPYNVVAAFDSRFGTFDTLDTDKSYGIRLLQTQKGLRLFSESPLVGVGPGRFRWEFVELDLPDYLSYGSQEHFNRLSAHNSYIGFLAEGGLIASIPFAMLVISLAVSGGIGCIRLLRAGEYWALGVYLCFISMSVHMWSISSLTNTANWFIYALNVAMIERTHSFPGGEHGVKAGVSLPRSRIIKRG